MPRRTRSPKSKKENRIGAKPSADSRIEGSKDDVVPQSPGEAFTAIISLSFPRNVFFVEFCVPSSMCIHIHLVFHALFVIA